VLQDPLVVQCRLGKPFTDIYVDALSQLEIKLTIKESKEGVIKGSLSASGEFGTKLLSKVGLGANIALDNKAAVDTKSVGHDIDDLRFIAEILKNCGRRLAVSSPEM
jgi:hypothetical protein